ncbi:MAG: hypothetical protein AB1610_02575 [Nitrospirota bacterium]
MKIKKIPAKLQPFLWSKSVEKLDRDKDNVYIIHQILSYGDFKEIRQLFRIYNRREITEIFIRSPKKIYQPSVFYFIKNHMLGLKNRKLREAQYVKTLF